MKFFTTTKLSEHIHETPEGFLLCTDVAIARTGEMIYGVGETPINPGPDGKVRVVRDAAEVFRKETMASFEGKPLTIFHPEDFVNPENWRELTHGIVQNVRRGEGEHSEDLMADILVTDAVAIELVKSGLREVSCGYDAEYVETGVGLGIQKDILGNHVALVEEGRAGSAYAINDHKGKGLRMLKDKFKAIFARATDEAMKAAAEIKEIPAEKKDEEKKTEEKKPTKDAILAKVKDLMEMLGAMQPDASSQPSNISPAEVKAKDEPVAGSLEDRLKKVEELLAKMLESQSGGDEKKDEEKKEESKDADKEEKKEESKDADKEEKKKEESEDEEPCMGGDGYGEEGDEPAETGDTASRVEILAPGLKAEGKDAKAKALKAAYETTDGKAIIHQFTGGKPLDYGNESFVDAVFIGASEVLKATRSNEFARTKVRDTEAPSTEKSKKAMSAEEINKKNESFYKQK